MRFVSLLLLALTAVLVVAMGWQHFRYLKWRRAAAQDHQPLLHSSSAFHVISYLRLESGGELVESLTKARETLDGAGSSCSFRGRSIPILPDWLHEKPVAPDRADHDSTK